jgi:hypothetical protein
MAGDSDLPDGEWVFRRIPYSSQWVKPDGSVDLAAFLPNRGDVTGLSLSRVNTAAEAGATGKRGKRFYAAALRVGELKARGLRVTADSPGHAEIEGWTFETRDSLEVRGHAAWMTTVCGRAEGPFDGEYDPP